MARSREKSLYKPLNMNALRQGRGARRQHNGWWDPQGHFRAFLPPRRRNFDRPGALLDARRARRLSRPPSRRRGRSMQIPRGDERQKNLVGGAWVPPSTDKYDACVNPADTREVLGHFPRSGPADAKAAVDAAAKAFPGWAATPGPERGRVLDRAHAILKSRVDLLAEALCREEGKVFD